MPAASSRSLQIRPTQPKLVFLADFLRLRPVFPLAVFLLAVFFFLVLIDKNALSPGDITRPFDHNDWIPSRSNFSGHVHSIQPGVVIATVAVKSGKYPTNIIRMSRKKASKANDAGSLEAGSRSPLVFLHSVTDAAAAENTLEIFTQLGWKAWTTDNTLKDAGTDAGEYRPERLGELLLELQRRSPNSMLLVIDAGLAIKEQSIKALMGLMDELSQGESEAAVLTALSNIDPELNPYAGLEPNGSDEPGQDLAEDLVALLGPGLLHGHHQWPQHLLYFSAGAAQLLAHKDTVPANALAMLVEQGGRLLLADSLFLHDPRRSLFEQAGLEAHEQRRPVAWGWF